MEMFEVWAVVSSSSFSEVEAGVEVEPVAETTSSLLKKPSDHCFFLGYLSSVSTCLSQ